MGLMETNLLGRGKLLTASFRKGAHEKNTVIEDAWLVSYKDPNLLGTRYQTYFLVQGLETGEIIEATFGKPYFSLETPWSWGLTTTHNRGRQRQYDSGELAADFLQQDNSGELDFGLALTRGPPVVNRVQVFYRYQQRRIKDFRRFTSIAAGFAPPPEYTYSYPGIGYRRLGVHYINETRINQFDREEFFNLANVLNLSIGYSAAVLGAHKDESIFSASDSQGYAFRKGHFLLVTASADGILDGKDLYNGLFSFSYNHYLRDTPLDFGPLLNTWHMEGVFEYGIDLDSSHILGLGYTNGLRGYDYDAFTGNKLLRISLEDRIFVKNRIFGLVALGLLLFWDAGYVWPDGVDMDISDLRHDVGVGLRTGIPPVAGSNIVNLTWGFPLGKGVEPFKDYVLSVVLSSTFN